MGQPGGKAQQLSWNTRDQQGRLTFLSPEVASPLRPVGSVFSLTSCKRRRAAVDRPWGGHRKSAPEGPSGLTCLCPYAQPSPALLSPSTSALPSPPFPNSWVRDPLKPGTCLIDTCCPRAWHSSRENTQLRAYSTQASKELIRSHGDHNFNYPPAPTLPPGTKSTRGRTTNVCSFLQTP